MTRRLCLRIVVSLPWSLGWLRRVRAAAGGSRRRPAAAAGGLARARRRSAASPSASSRRRRRPSGSPPATSRASGQATQFTKGENGVWEVTIGPVDPGAYRYNFNVDGVTTIDPRNPFISESNNNVWSLVHVPGSEFADTKNVPHGGVAAVTYYSTALGTFRRMHVYTPPGYEREQRQVPGLLPAARRRRQRRLVDVGRPRRIHPRQPDRRRRRPSR